MIDSILFGQGVSYKKPKLKRPRRSKDLDAVFVCSNNYTPNQRWASDEPFAPLFEILVKVPAAHEDFALTRYRTYLQDKLDESGMTFDEMAELLTQWQQYHLVDSKIRPNSVFNSLRMWIKNWVEKKGMEALRGRS